MSRLGKTPISIPKGVELKAGKDGALQFKGPKGTLEMKLPLGLSLKISGHEAVVERDETLLPEKAMHGLYRSLILNHIIGVSEGFEVKLTLIGVGYRAAVQGNKLDLSLGFSHPTQIIIPKTIQVAIDKGTAISIKGPDKREVGQFAASVRAMKPPEPYKGKGVRYEDEYVRKKEGKAAKGKA
ncbi:MAG: 50S ribosomal protein L6 [Verrucomicrobia bacterium]|nr:50S ribosomal protein L6 [Verrucomicrobiota bacterium]